MAAVLGCRGGGTDPQVSDSTFVAAMARLQLVQADSTLDRAARTAARSQVLQEQGLTREQLERAADALSGDPERALAVWRAIEQRVLQGAVVPPTP